MAGHFRPDEYACKCGRPECDARPMDFDFVMKLEALRVLWGKPMTLLSARRCPYWNKEVGGASGSQHLYGKAVDVKITNRLDAEKFIALAEKVGFGGIGTAKSFVHIDTGPSGRRWTY